MPLTLKQQMAKTLAQMIVEQPEKFNRQAVAARCFLSHIDDWGNQYGWEVNSRSWNMLRPLLEEALPALMEADTEK